MEFRITLHAGPKSPARPADALDLLWERLGSRQDQASFAKVGSEIRATWGNDAPASVEWDERSELGREALLDIVIDVCERAPQLKSDWFAVSARR